MLTSFVTKEITTVEVLEAGWKVHKQEIMTVQSSYLKPIYLLSLDAEVWIIWGKVHGILVVSRDL